MTMERKKTPQLHRWPRILTVIMVVVALGIGAIVLGYLQDELITAAGKQMALIAESGAEKLDRFLYQHYRDIEMLAHAAPLERQDTAATQKYLARVQQENPLLYWIGVTDAKGRIVAATNPVSVGADRSGRAWSQSVRDTRKVHVRDATPSEDSGGTWAVAFTAPIVNRNGDFVGTVSARHRLLAISEIFPRTIQRIKSTYGPSVEVEMQVLNRDGLVIRDSRLEEEGKVNLRKLGLPSAVLSAAGNAGYVEEEHLRRQVQVVTGYARTQDSQNVHGLDWGVLVRFDREAILVPIHDALWRIGSVGLLMLLPLVGGLVWATRRLETERMQVRQSEARYQGILDVASEAIISIDGAHRITIFNQGAEQIFGYRPDEVLGQSLDILLPEGARPTHSRHIEEFAGSGHVTLRMEGRREVSGRRKNGHEFPAEASLSKYEIGHDKIMTVVLRDITDRKQAQEALQQAHDALETRVQERTADLETAHAQLLHAAKLAAAGRLSASIAHEFNSPLCGVRNVLEQTLEQIPGDGGQRELLGLAVKECTRMADLIAKLRDFHRPSTGTVIPTNLHTLLDEVLALLARPLQQRQVTVVKEYAPAACEVAGVADQLNQVFLNLLTNASEAMSPAGGTLTLRTERDTTMVRVSVQDTGAGIAPEHMSRLFEPFFTTKGAVTGTGLGLAVSYGIVQNHGGTLTVASPPGQGATFTVTLPLKAGGAP